MAKAQPQPPTVAPWIAAPVPDPEPQARDFGTETVDQDREIEDFLDLVTEVSPAAPEVAALDGGSAQPAEAALLAVAPLHEAELAREGEIPSAFYLNVLPTGRNLPEGQAGAESADLDRPTSPEGEVAAPARSALGISNPLLRRPVKRVGRRYATDQSPALVGHVNPEQDRGSGELSAVAEAAAAAATIGRLEFDLASAREAVAVERERTDSVREDLATVRSELAEARAQAAAARERADELRADVTYLRDELAALRTAGRLAE